MAKIIFAFVFVVIGSAAVKADGILIATSGSAQLQVGFSVPDVVAIIISGANGSMSFATQEASVVVRCNEAGCPRGTTVSVRTISGFTPGIFGDSFQINLNGTTRTCGSTSFCSGFFSLDATAVIPDDGGSGISGFFSVTVPFTFTGSLTGFFPVQESFSFAGSGFASFSLARPALGYIVPGTIQYTFNAPEPGSIFLL